MNETAKCYKRRVENGDFKNYLHGHGIDIGCGSDPLKLPEGTGDVDLWDRALGHGDAEYMAGVLDEKYDFVYSSHCLEHMRGINTAILNWVRILKPGGFLYIVVPDYILYEKMTWPSRFNQDHKHSFSLSEIPTGRDSLSVPTHWNPKQLLTEFGLDFHETRIEDHGFDYNRGIEDQTLGKALAQICCCFQKPLILGR